MKVQLYLVDQGSIKYQHARPPADLVEFFRAKEGLALCVNIKGEWRLREKGYMCISPYLDRSN